MSVRVVNIDAGERHILLRGVNAFLPIYCPILMKFSIRDLLALLLSVLELGNIRVQGSVWFCYGLTRNYICAFIILKVNGRLTKHCVLPDSVILIGLSLCVILGIKCN